MTPGYIFGGVQAVTMLLDLLGTRASDYYGRVQPSWSLCFSLGTGIWLLVYTYRLHEALKEKTGGRYPISPGKAVGYQFIPLFGIFWLFFCLVKMIGFLADHSRGPRIHKGLPFLLLPISLALYFIRIPMGYEQIPLLSVLGAFPWLMLYDRLGRGVAEVLEEGEESETRKGAGPADSAPGESRRGEPFYPIALACVFLTSLYLYLLMRSGISFPFWQNIGATMGHYFLLTIGFVLLMRRREIDLSIGFQMALGAYLCETLLLQGGAVNPLFAILCALAVGAAVGALQGALTGYGKFPSFLVTLAGGWGIRLLLLRLMSRPLASSLGPLRPWLPLILALSISGLLGALLILRPALSRYKKKPALLTLLSFSLMGALAAFGGVFHSIRIGTVHPGMSHSYEVMLIFIALAAGCHSGSLIRTLLRAAAACLTFSLLQNTLTFVSIPFYNQRILFALLILAYAGFYAYGSHKKGPLARQREIRQVWVLFGVGAAYLLPGLLMMISDALVLEREGLFRLFSLYGDSAVILLFGTAGLMIERKALSSRGE